MTMSYLIGKNIFGNGENAGHQHFLLFSVILLLINEIKSYVDDRSKYSLNDNELFDRVKTFLEMEKMLVTSIFSFSHKVFKKLSSKVVNSLDYVVYKGLCDNLVSMMHLKDASSSILLEQWLWG